jgi:hypothetical protein
LVSGTRGLRQFEDAGQKPGWVQVWLEGDLRMTRRASGYMGIGADGAGEHDDLAIALALAVWKGAKMEMPRSLYGNCRILQM